MIYFIANNNAFNKISVFCEESDINNFYFGCRNRILHWKVYINHRVIYWNLMGIEKIKHLFFKRPKICREHAKCYMRKLNVWQKELKVNVIWKYNYSDNVMKHK